MIGEPIRGRLETSAATNNNKIETVLDSDETPWSRGEWGGEPQKTCSPPVTVRVCCRK